jgi:hypothetical protein
MEKLLAALIPVLCIVAFGPLLCQNMAAPGRKPARPALEGGSHSTERPLCEVAR